MKSCLTCKHLAWWDGDYCCMHNLSLLSDAPKGVITEDAILTFNTNGKYCKSYQFQEPKYKVNLDM